MYFMYGKLCNKSEMFLCFSIRKGSNKADKQQYFELLKLSYFEFLTLLKLFSRSFVKWYYIRIA